MPEKEKLRLDKIFSSIKPETGDWKKKYFEGIPTVAAVTILTRFQNDCQNAALIALGDIKKRLIK